MTLVERKLLERDITIHRGVLYLENGDGHELYRGVDTPRDYWRYYRTPRLEHDADGWTTAFDGFGQIGPTSPPRSAAADDRPGPALLGIRST